MDVYLVPFSKNFLTQTILLFGFFKTDLRENHATPLPFPLPPSPTTVVGWPGFYFNRVGWWRWCKENDANIKLQAWSMQIQTFRPETNLGTLLHVHSVHCAMLRLFKKGVLGISLYILLLSVGKQRRNFVGWPLMNPGKVYIKADNLRNF